MGARPRDDLSLFDPLELSAGVRMAKLLMVSRLVEELTGKQFPEVKKDDRDELFEQVGIARLFQRKESINTHSLAKEIGTSGNGLRSRIDRRKRKKQQ